MREKMITIWDELVQMNKVRPYVFKTRLQRAILRTTKYGMEQDDTSLQQLCEKLEHKLAFISDQSNQTSDGELRSYLILKEDMEQIRVALCIK